MQLPAAPFDGFHALPAAVSKTLLVRFDHNSTRWMPRLLAGP